MLNIGSKLVLFLKMHLSLVSLGIHVYVLVQHFRNQVKFRCLHI